MWRLAIQQFITGVVAVLQTQSHREMSPNRKKSLWTIQNLKAREMCSFFGVFCGHFSFILSTGLSATHLFFLSGDGESERGTLNRMVAFKEVGAACH